MIKKTITYKTFDGEEVTEDFFFHLSRADIVELEVSRKGGLQETLKQLIESEDGAEIMELFKKILGMSVGRKSPDGKRFIHSEEIRNDFFQSNAYDVFFIELVTNTDVQIEFIQGIVPADMMAEATDEQKQELKEVIEGVKPSDGPQITTPTRKLTSEELAVIDADDLKSGLASGRYTL